MSDKEYFKPLAAVLLILIKDNKILLQRRFNTKYGNGMYNFVSGHIDGNEPASKAMIREAKEEIGIDIQEKDLKFVHTQHSTFVDGKEYVYFFFSANTWQGEPKIMETNKSDDLAWFSLNDLPHNFITNQKDVLELYNKNVFYSEFGWNNVLVE
jgi:8-oxo-dGTP diphosphatase